MLDYDQIKLNNQTNLILRTCEKQNASEQVSFSCLNNRVDSRVKVSCFHSQVSPVLRNHLGVTVHRSVVSEKKAKTK